MRKYEVRSHKVSKKFDIYGEPTSEEYEYTISYKVYGLLWRHLRFYPEQPQYTPMVCRCLDSSEVTIQTMPLRMATRFLTEDDAIRVKLDMMQNPDKYVFTKE